jgi:hypothetical protein
MADLNDIKKITGTVEDAVTYPILTKEIDGYAGRAGDSDLSARGGSLTRTAQGAIRDLLGWRYRANDSKGFVAALTKAVDLKEVEGHVEWTWKARPFMVQADLGEVTGAQASLYERAKVAQGHAIPLLDGLNPQRADADDEEVDSIRAIVRSAWTEMVVELGVVSGPRIQRVDEYFRQLLGSSDPTKPDVADAIKKPEKVKGNLGRLAKRFGFSREGVLTVEEEQNFTNFLILVDNTTSLLTTWAAQKDFLLRNGSGDKFLGTQLVRLAEELAVIVESVHEAYAAMDSVFFGPEERQVTVLTFEGTISPFEGTISLITEPITVEPITVAELLNWIEQFASVEARTLIEDSGRDGVLTVSDTLKQFGDMLNAIVQQS